MIILPMLLLIRILANSILRFHITGPGTRLNLRSKIKSINQSINKRAIPKQLCGYCVSIYAGVRGHVRGE